MQIWKLSKQAIAEQTASALKRGKVLACPTDTVYIWMVDATNKNAVRRVFQIKGRPSGKPLPIFVSSIATAKRLAKVRPLQEQYMRKVWPGKVTVVLKSRGVLPKETGTKETIGLRIPKHKLVQMILETAKLPLTGTSANLSGEPPLRDSKEIMKQFAERKYQPDILLDAGKLPHSRVSRVVDITKEKPLIIRK